MDTTKTRTFATGATRDGDADKIDYEGFLSPLVLERYGRYMHSHRRQSDGKLRASDNWQLGIPREQYMKSLWRHLVEAWTSHRGFDAGSLEDALCAVIFNASGYLHELLKERQAALTGNRKPEAWLVQLGMQDAIAEEALAARASVPIEQRPLAGVAEQR